MSPTRASKGLVKEGVIDRDNFFVIGQGTGNIKHNGDSGVGRLTIILPFDERFRRFPLVMIGGYCDSYRQSSTRWRAPTGVTVTGVMEGIKDLLLHDCITNTPLGEISDNGMGPVF